MREKELRIALVCFGGVSLAVYMHGISKEILKLVRASRALHAIADRSRRAQTEFFDCVDGSDPEHDAEHDTEAVYFELLREIGQSLELRVIVDIIAGASAGGINGTMLARALSHDLPMEALRELWLKNADVDVLLSAEARARRWSKWFLQPLFWAAGATGRFQTITDLEVRQKLSLFVRSRWFRPPLDGRVMAGLMYDAVTSMGTAKDRKSSLLPSGQLLDLFVTLTDYYGYQELVQIHDPPLIHELDHHHVLHFTYRRHSNGDVESDFELDNAPGLAFAARATSSFPGAFPPARIVEMDEVVAQRQGRWPRRAEFIAKEFPAHLRAEIDPATASFLDGSVLNNRPFLQAISAIHGRPAYREVDRRLVYIDPHPAPLGLAAATAGPGLLRDAARRAVGYPELAAGDRRARPRDRVQRPGAPAARDHRQRAAPRRRARDQGRDHHVRPGDLDRRRARLARAGERARRARRRLCLPGLCAAQARVGARLRRRADRQAAGHARAIAAVARWWPRSSTPGRCARASSTPAPTARRSSSRRRRRITSRPG